MTPSGQLIRPSRVAINLRARLPSIDHALHRRLYTGVYARASVCWHSLLPVRYCLTLEPNDGRHSERRIRPTR